MNNRINGINKFIEGKTFVYDHRVSFNEKPVKGYYQFHIDKVSKLRSVGEDIGHLFVSVKLVNGEGMVNYYLCAFGNKQKMTGRLNVSKQWYEFSVQISNDIEQFLQFFSIDMPVVVDNFEFAPSKDFVPLINLENEK
ncbi:hypothetical protein UFOVP117_145 [uncultured Caudovirales phage]|uniref:Uncharacterized protein n=1 Tax=uncultured Caudovirales phage TaxID=2100421 RepID=A0A6J5LAD0_9CAUD|nr:hypothetical protein UFOVP117_145 [uncultured Caudovirales phage]